MKKILFIIAVVIIVIVIAAIYWKDISNFLPTLVDRVLFGDFFGTLNTLFSDLALIGVVCALFLQQRQLKGMQKSFQLQYQPVLQIHPRKFVVDKPSLFARPDDNDCHALSRYHLDFELRNVSDTTAIDAVVSTTLISITDSSKEKITTVASHFPVVTKNSVAEGSNMFVPDKPFVKFFEALRDKDALRIPTIDVEILYKNLIGGCFLIRQAFHVFLGPEDSELGNWQTTISSFPATFKSEIHKLRDLEKEPSRWHEYFDEIKSRYVKGIAGPQEIVLSVEFIPGAHVARHITESEYAELIDKISFPQHTFAETKCLVNRRVNA